MGGSERSSTLTRRVRNSRITISRCVTFTTLRSWWSWSWIVGKGNDHTYHSGFLLPRKTTSCISPTHFIRIPRLHHWQICIKCHLYFLIQTVPFWTKLTHNSFPSPSLLENLSQDLFKKKYVIMIFEKYKTYNK